MIKRFGLSGRLFAFVAALLLAACASPSPQVSINGAGRVNAIQESQQVSQGKSAGASIGGALVGGAIGSLFGGGSGKTIMTAVGATAGGVAANSAVSNHGASTVWDVSIRFEDGIDRVVRTNQPPPFRPGDRVRVINGAIMPY
jgi:outer membrane lipoprotein SlyB